ncbi:hypothetical protein Afil01_50400 [Actinorhabdospora filicis]|uniref:CYTH domain-containing protein n=1 Tax=Actinorhabdospora filicis TaxID=1785913 RepID=A0A9W6SQF9_9ACTN|nr:hypothetical protein [Actinorhabdospora filicis]GLZ80233.1 hypothetical protein Afil01_50400 [Actinorhabdospora filicis]
MGSGIEYEAKLLDVDPEAMAALILDRGGHRVGEALQRRLVYDITPGDPGRWLRLRDDGTTVTLAVKEIAHDGIDGTTETEVVVGDFDTTRVLLAKLGHTARSYQENRRASFTLGGAALEIDSWPLIPPYLEIEAHDAGTVHRAARLLGVDPAALTGENTVEVYRRHGIDLAAIAHLTF